MQIEEKCPKPKTMLFEDSIKRELISPWLLCVAEWLILWEMPILNYTLFLVIWAMCWHMKYCDTIPPLWCSFSVSDPKHRHYWQPLNADTARPALLAHNWHLDCPNLQHIKKCRFFIKIEWWMKLVLSIFNCDQRNRRLQRFITIDKGCVSIGQYLLFNSVILYPLCECNPGQHQTLSRNMMWIMNTNVGTHHQPLTNDMSCQDTWSDDLFSCLFQTYLILPLNSVNMYICNYWHSHRWLINVIFMTN